MSDKTFEQCQDDVRYWWKKLNDEWSETDRDVNANNAESLIYAMRDASAHPDVRGTINGGLAASYYAFDKNEQERFMSWFRNVQVVLAAIKP
jgi:hypothetical protein